MPGMDSEPFQAPRNRTALAKILSARTLSFDSAVGRVRSGRRLFQHRDANKRPADKGFEPFREKNLNPETVRYLYFSFSFMKKVARAKALQRRSNP